MRGPKRLIGALLALLLAWPAAAAERVAGVELPLAPVAAQAPLSLSALPPLAQSALAPALPGLPAAAALTPGVSPTALPAFAEPSASAAPAAAPDRAVPSALAAARRGDPRELAALSLRAGDWFDGLPAAERAGLIDDLEAVAKQSPRNVPARHFLQSLVVRDELAHIEPRLRGGALTAQRREAVLSKTTVRDIKWHHHFTDEILPVPEGVATDELTITLNVKSHWRKMASFASHLRTIFSHEYTHRLQFEGEFKDGFGQEAAAVATEMLRAVELVGLEDLAKGKLPCLGVGHMNAFNQGRQWARSGAPEKETGWYWKGFLAGAAFEVAERSGSWSDAWRFLRRVESGEKPSAAARALMRSGDN